MITTDDIKLVKTCDMCPEQYDAFYDVKHNPTWTILFTWGKPKHWAFWLKDSMKRKNRDKYFIEHGHHICDN